MEDVLSAIKNSLNEFKPSELKKPSEEIDTTMTILHALGARHIYGIHLQKLKIGIAVCLLLSASHALGQGEDSVRTAGIATKALSFSFVGTKEGLQIASFRNSITGTEYLRANPAAAAPQSSATNSPINPRSPFAVAVQSGGSSKTLQAATDADILSWASSPGRFHTEFQFRGLLLSGEMTITAGQFHTFWTCRLHNHSTAPLEAEFFFPAFAPLVVKSPSEDRVVLPMGTGGVWDITNAAAFQLQYGSMLISPSAVYHGAAEGIYLVDNNRSDLGSKPDQCCFRSILVRSVSQDNSNPTGSVLSISHRIHLEPGCDITLGPVIVGTYTGGYEEGLQQIRIIRQRVLRPKRPPEWLQHAYVVILSRTLDPKVVQAMQECGAALVVLDVPSNIEKGDYFNMSSLAVASLRQFVDQVHAAGHRVLLGLDASSIPPNSQFAGTTEAFEMSVSDTKETAHGALTMCPAHTGWQERFAELCYRLVRSTGADGIALRGVAPNPTPLCLNKAHKHPTPYVWNWGVRNLLKLVRTRLNRIHPDTALLTIGGCDFTLEIADGMILEADAQPHNLAEYPVTRAVHPDACLYAVLPPADAEKAIAQNTACGFRTAASFELKSQDALLKRLARYMQAAPELTTTLPVRCKTQPNTPDIMAFLYAGTNTVVAAANLSDEPQTFLLSPPTAAAFLEDPLTKLRIERDASGAFAVTLMPKRACVWIAH